MSCFSEDCAFLKQHGDCFYDGVPPSNSPKTCEACGFFKAKTHYDRIRAMTDEELAEFVARQRFCTLNPIADKLGIDITQMFVKCRDIMLDWLKQEAVSDG